MTYGTTTDIFIFLEPTERKLQHWEGLGSSWVSLEPAGRASEPAGRASEPAGRALEPAGEPWSQLGGPLKPAGRASWEGQLRGPEGGGTETKKTEGTEHFWYVVVP